MKKVHFEQLVSKNGNVEAVDEMCTLKGKLAVISDNVTVDEVADKGHTTSPVEGQLRTSSSAVSEVRYMP